MSRLKGVNRIPKLQISTPLLRLSPLHVSSNVAIVPPTLPTHPRNASPPNTSSQHRYTPPYTHPATQTPHRSPSPPQTRPHPPRPRAVAAHSGTRAPPAARATRGPGTWPAIRAAAGRRGVVAAVAPVARVRGAVEAAGGGAHDDGGVGGGGAVGGVEEVGLEVFICACWSC